MRDDFDLKKLRKKKTRINSRTKGNAFERQISKLLNERFDTTEFCRSPGSGAFASTHSLPEHLQIYGDLITPIKFKYCIECKKGYNKQAVASLFNNRSDFWVFMKKCEKDARACKKLPMLIFKQDRQPTLAVIKGRKWFSYSQDYEGLTDFIKVKEYTIFKFDEILRSWDTSDWWEAELPEGSRRK